MNLRTFGTLGLAVVAAALCGCATPYDADKPVYQGKEYRTGSNIAVRDGEPRGSATVVKPDDVPLYRPQVQRTGGPAPVGP